MTATQPTVSKADLQFTIVTAVYNVARYLDDFIESIEGQTFPRGRFEVIAVNDGSTDESLAKLRAWEERQPGLVKIVTQDNAGLPSARNAGLPFVRGAWVTFADPDDRLAPDYFSEVAAFLEEHPTASMVATRLLILNDATGELTDTHPLRNRFHHGNRLRNLEHYPDHFHGHAPTGFFSLGELKSQGRRFDPEVRPQFEDGHFSCRYLLEIAQPSIGFVATTSYHYRQRSDGTSMQQGIIGQSERYTRVLRRGFLDLLQRGAEVTGSRLAPEWLQNFILYQLSWYFSTQETHAGTVSEAVGPVADEFHALLEEILRYVSKETIAGFSVRRLKPVWEEILLHGYEPEPWHTPYGLVTQLDSDQGIVRITYRFTGDPPVEELRSGGQIVPPAHAKVRDLEYLNRVLLRERILWVSQRQSVRLRLNGADLDLQFTVRRRNHILQPGKIRNELKPDAAARSRVKLQRTVGDRLVLRLARTRLVRRFFGDAWVLMDRITDAGDSAEHLFRYLRKSRRKINAWFVVEGGTVDWRRLRADGYVRMVPHGSLRWKLLMANCRHLISSHVDVPVVRPPAILEMMEPAWRFTFLGHGVTQRDLSSWLNTKQIDLFITSTPAEHGSIAGDHSLYTVTTKETKLIGMPRFDRLLEIAEQWPEERRDLVLIAPTWRMSLAPPVERGSHRRRIDPAFFESEFARNWMSVLASPRLAEVCDEERLVIGFLPHPNLQPALPDMALPPHVLPLTFVDNNVQELFSRSAVLVTDYSSMAFDAAYINRPVVYFQFDNQEFGGGAHHGRRGYFNYEGDGFGPVAYTAEEVIEAITDTIRAGRSPSPTYQARGAATFLVRDGGCCERVTEEIQRSTRRVSVAAAAIPEPAPLMPVPGAIPASDLRRIGGPPVSERGGREAAGPSR